MDNGTGASGPTVFLTQKAIQQGDDRNFKQENVKNAINQTNQTNQTSQSTLLLQKKKEMMEVQAMLDKKREEFNERMQRCHQKEVELAARQQQIREQVSKFDKFLKDNDAKRTRANKRATDEIKSREQKESEIVKLHHELEGMKVDKEVKKSQLERNSRYERYLNSVIEAYNEFPEIHDLLMRYDTLTAANSDLLESVKKSFEESEKYRIRMQTFIKETQNEILVYNSEVAKKQQLLEEKVKQTAELEQTMQEREKISKTKAQTLGEIKMAISNLYSRACQKHYKESATPEEKLKAIEQKIVDYQDIVTSAIREKKLDLTRTKTA